MRSDSPEHPGYKSAMRNQWQRQLVGLVGMAIAEVVLPALADDAPTAAPVEAWECTDVLGDWDKIIVEAYVGKGRTAGSIRVAGVIHKTVYRVAGFQRRWDFGAKSDGSYSYAFIVDPDGSASYFDFSGSKTARPSMVMKCRMRPER
jgi:hypothetical protein